MIIPSCPAASISPQQAVAVAVDEGIIDTVTAHYYYPPLTTTTTTELYYLYSATIFYHTRHNVTKYIKTGWQRTKNYFFVKGDKEGR